MTGITPRNSNVRIHSNVVTMTGSESSSAKLPCRRESGVVRATTVTGDRAGKQQGRDDLTGSERSFLAHYEYIERSLSERKTEGIVQRRGLSD